MPSLSWTTPVKESPLSRTKAEETTTLLFCLVSVILLQVSRIFPQFEFNLNWFTHTITWIVIKWKRRRIVSLSEMQMKPTYVLKRKKGSKMAEETPRYAVVTGANRGIGLEICRQLASKGIRVVLTSRDETKGIEAVETLKKETGVSDQSLVFHQLDVSDPASITSLAEFVKTKFGKLDILVNNAGVSGNIITDVDALRSGMRTEGFKWDEIITETYELAEECIKINYYGPKRMCEAFIPLLQLSDSPRIVNVSSSMGQLKNLLNEWAKGILSDAENLTEERIDQLLNDFKQGTVKKRNWAKVMSAYVVSKAALNGYTRIIAKKHPGFLVNSVCPGFVKTDINFNIGVLSVEEGASSPVRLALLPHQEIPSGCFFVREQLSEF